MTLLHPGDVFPELAVQLTDGRSIVVPEELSGGTFTISNASGISGAGFSLTLGGASNDGDGGSDSFSGIETLLGSAFNDNLTGNGGNNGLSGGAGNRCAMVSARSPTVW